MTNDPMDGRLGARLRALRERRSLSMSAVGRQIGTTYQQVRKYESGENRISASTLYRLANILGVDIAYFFREEAPAPSMPDAGAKLDGAASTDASLNAALDRVDDDEIRLHLRGLLVALSPRG